MPDSSKVERGPDKSETKERYLLWRPIFRLVTAYEY